MDCEHSSFNVLDIQHCQHKTSPTQNIVNTKQCQHKTLVEIVMVRLTGFPVGREAGAGGRLQHDPRTGEH